MKYELEKHRVYAYLTEQDIYETIKESDNDRELRALANTIKLKSGKTFYEKLVINEKDQNGDTQDVEEVKQSDWK